LNTRIIVKLDIKPPYVVKPIYFEGLRKIGLTKDLMKKYYLQNIDEIYYIDIVSSLYQRDIQFTDIINSIDDIFIPLSIGGAIKSLDDISRLLHIGADKVAINTYALKDPTIINKASQIFGKQAIVVNIEAKKWDHCWECYSDGGKIRQNKDLLQWVKEVEQRGAGEIFLQSIDNDGTKKGFDLELAKKVVDLVDIPVVIASGAGSLEDIKELILYAKPSGIAISSILHYNDYSINEIKQYLNTHNIKVSL